MAETPAAALLQGPPTLNVGDNGLATITLNRPQHLNRLHREDLLVLQAQLRQLATDPAARVLVLTGTGRAFCAGFNIQELQQSAATAQADTRLFQHTVDALAALPLPSVARLNGSVYGGATDLALACDFCVGVQGMELRMPAAQLGLHYYPSGMQRYVSRLGLQTAKRLFLLAEAVGADELLHIGYLDALVPAAELDDATARYTSALLLAAPLAVQGMKLTLNDLAGGQASDEQLRLRESRCALSDDLQEGLRAYAERRPPRFQGR